MGYKDITDGEKIGRPTHARFIRSKSGTMGLEVSFVFKQGANEERLNWVGWLSEKALENTMKTLVETLGFNGDETTDDQGNLTHPQALAWDHEVKLVIEHETNPANDKTYPRIKWVNKLGGSAYAACVPQTIKNDLGALGFKAAFLAAKQSVPSQRPQQLEPEQDLAF